jgi:hypothetical protein
VNVTDARPTPVLPAVTVAWRGAGNGVPIGATCGVPSVAAIVWLAGVTLILLQPVRKFMTRQTTPRRLKQALRLIGNFLLSSQEQQHDSAMTRRPPVFTNYFCTPSPTNINAGLTLRFTHADCKMKCASYFDEGRNATEVVPSGIVISCTGPSWLAAGCSFPV